MSLNLFGKKKVKILDDAIKNEMDDTEFDKHAGLEIFTNFRDIDNILNSVSNKIIYSDDFLHLFLLHLFFCFISIN
jgi:hypothetical protein